MDLKTPVSLLQEHLVKEGILPTYQLIHCGTGTHQPYFEYEVKARNISAVGKGRSKKEAKQEAAKLLLCQLEGETIWKEETPLISPHIPSVKGNLIGALQEYCIQHSIPYPQYEFVSDEGNLTAHIFVKRCTVLSYTTEGKASTKQQAKHLAAKAMLSKLHNVEEKVIDMSLSKIEEKKELTLKAYNKTMEAFQKNLHERQDRTLASTNTMKNLLNFADYFRNKIGPRSTALNSLKNMDDELLENHKDPRGLLSLIMEELGYKFKYEFLNSKSSDMFLCNLLVNEISINCMGAAKCKTDAQKKAAINTLKVLLVLSKP
ncbi:protein Loquacious [Halyomorpha halys]|uniref:protein Loquacious n=1 Tax=Halyomorpha halys TaxID=286706 RepID=UPI0006D4E71E|nr:RISC-loading complex subunit tarbp2-like [Halyomorpha halys]XP_014285642.1 RISC-loading complex subunit tarbp2-like [Halyomorpha halys]XP_014285643.1 RISC-loading complex subunit tarbp2-like [Halyomorpha halys]XP_014285644.1 RISC-loading complex subunit tarbp2-like [Halyomorpha halys]KAE8574066.1 Putative Interferon-inducible double stranded RNA-dependent protein kinase activator A [Halyomorpha halys]